MKNNYFQWDAHFVTGHTTIDQQHSGLIETINDLMKLSFQSEELKEEDLDDLKVRLTDYTLSHFQTEEVLMQEFSLDPRHKEVHENLHRDFVDKVQTYFQSEVDLKSQSVLGEINEFLIRWLAYHILSMDKSLVRQVDRIKNEKVDPKEAYDMEVEEEDVNTEPLLKALKSLFFLVSQKNKELEIINEGLEQKVKARTRELEEANQQLENLSLRDELTGLPNRRFVVREIEKLICDRDRYGTAFSVLFVDLDKFKAVNDDHGHECGDEVLKWVSEFLNGHTRKNDVVCRLGGDEFIIIAAHCRGPETVAMAENLLDLISNLKVDEKTPYWEPSLSLGVIEMDDSIDSVSDLLTKADAAMYESKRAGGKAVRSYKGKEGYQIITS